MLKKLMLMTMTGCLLNASASYAGPVTAELGLWATDGWTQFGDDDGVVGPGGGGQAFDAEYLYYKLDGNTLSLGLQTGYDVVDGVQTYNGGSRLYHAGDLALSVDGQVNSGAGAGSSYEYGIDFGLLTVGYSNSGALIDSGSGTGIDDAGLYEVSGWSNDVYSGHHESDPFAIDDGAKLSDLLTNTAGYDAGLETYYRTVSFDVTGLGWGEDFILDAHWTMSCGNDAIDGHVAVVPEPTTLPLLGLGFLGFALRKRSKA